MTPAGFRTLVARAALAPSVHNTQPARFRLADSRILVVADPAVWLQAADPSARDMGLSCGAAAEAMVLALSEQSIAATLADHWPDRDTVTVPGYRLAAILTMGGPTTPDRLAGALDRRFTHRGLFRTAEPPDWHPADAILVSRSALKSRIALLNDAASLELLRRTPDRAELLDWMRLSPRHPAWDRDGLNSDALRMSAFEARLAPLALGPLWRLVDLLHLTPILTTEAARTCSATIIAAFHQPDGQSPVTTGRAYLRLTLDAASRGLAMWPMAALADDDRTRAILQAELGIPPDRRLVQMIRFGPPDRPPPPRARRPADDLVI